MKIEAMVIIAVLLIGIGFVGGYAVKGSFGQKIMAAAVKKATKEEDKKRQELTKIAIHNAVESALLKDRAKQKQREVVRYVKVHPTDPECYDAAGVQLVNQAIADTQGKN